MKEDLISKLIDTFKQETEKISNSLDGVVNFKYEEFFKKNNPQKGYHSIDALIIFKNYTLKFEYKINVSMLIPKSTIEMRFMFENGKLPVEYSMYDVLEIVDKNNFKTYTFPYVTSESKMKDILNYLFEEFKSYKDSIAELSENIDKITVLENNIDKKIQILLDENVFKSRDAFFLIHMLELYYALDISRFTLDGYLDYIKGNFKKAINKYKKLGKKITAYEERLIAYMKENEAKKPVADNLNTLLQAKKYKSFKYEFIPIFISWLFLTPAWCIIYDIIFYIALYFLSKNAIYIGGTEQFMLFMPAFITAIISSFFARKKVYKIFFRKQYKDIIALDEIENTKKTEHIMFKILQFIIAAGIVSSVLTANTNISFYEDYFRNNLALLDIKGEMVEYSDVECVYKAASFKNGFGNIVDYTSYIMVLQGGEQIDLSYYIDNKEIERDIIPILKKHNIEMRDIDMVENIQKDIDKIYESQEK